MPDYQITAPDGNSYQVTAPEGASQEDVLSYAQQNYQAKPAPDQSPVDQVKDEAMAFGRGALRNFPMAQQATAGLSGLGNKAGLGTPTYSDEIQHLTDAAEASKAAHGVAYGAGAVTGAVAPMFIPGVGEAMEAAPIATNAAIGALGAPSDTNIVKDPLKAAGEAVTGAGTGAATSWGLGKLLGNAPEALENVANKQAVKSAMLNRNYLGHMDADEVSDLGDFMTEHGLVNRNTQEALDQAKLIKDAYGNQIGQIGADAAELKNPKSFIDSLSEKADKYEGRADPEFKKLANTYNYAIEELKGLGKKPTFADLQELKGVYGDHAFNADHTIANKAAADVYFTIKDAMNHIIKDAPEDYAGALKGYSYSSEVLNGLTKKLGTERAGSQGIGFGSIGRVIRQLPGPVRAAAGTAAALSGHPYVAGMAALPEIMNPALHSQVLNSAAKNIGGLSKAAQLELSNALESKFGQGK